MDPIKVKSDETADFLEKNKENVVVIIFDAPFTNQEDIVNSAIDALKAKKKTATHDFVLAVVDAEDNHAFATQLSVVTLPCVALLAKGQLVKKIIDLEPDKLINQLDNEISSVQRLTPEKVSDPKERLKSYLEQLINKAPIMVFMKGEPSAPRCGFSKQLVELLARNDVKYSSFNILDDDEVRQGLKEHSQWPTYPQIYASGEFIGGLDILKQLEETNELKETLKI